MSSSSANIRTISEPGRCGFGGLDAPKNPQQAEIMQAALVCFLICSYLCLYSPCVGREDPSFSRYPDAERTGIKTSMVVFEVGGRGGEQCRLASGQERLRNILLHRWVTAARGTALLLPFLATLPAVGNSIFQPKMPMFSKLILRGCGTPLEEC